MSLPTVYEHFTSGGITSGLSDNQPYFTLNNKNITIYSGGMHYFRVPQEYWRDRLKKMRAAGLNTVETYVPWNLHEPQPGIYDFGAGGTDFQEMLHIEKFLKIAQEEDLLAIVRPGPYICGEWEFGGLPSWLLRDKGIKLRTSDQIFMSHVERYFRMLLPILAALQFTKGGPIIAMQIENEYGSVYRHDLEYLRGIQNLYRNEGITELLFTSDGTLMGNYSQIPGILYTANFGSKAKENLDALNKYQKDKPVMTMEFWDGWFDQWMGHHHTKDAKSFENMLNEIINYPGSVNFCMFHGGTTFGFLNGANLEGGAIDNAGFVPTTNSYDYDAPLNEFGNFTEKYYITRKISKNLNSSVNLPNIPENSIPQKALDSLPVLEYLDLEDLISQVDANLITESKTLLPMEMLPINNNSGQSYGYVVYRKTNLDIPENSTLMLNGRVHDTMMVLINGKLISEVLNTTQDLNSFGYWKKNNAELNLGDVEYEGATLDLVVENWGRANYGQLSQFQVQFKGLLENQIVFNQQILSDWRIIPLEFKKRWNNQLKGWKTWMEDLENGPKLCRSILQVDENGAIPDTFIATEGWNKGIFILNGFVLSRYSKLGPQQAAYLPGAFLNRGYNEILVFEHFEASREIHFSSGPIFKTP